MGWRHLVGGIREDLILNSSYPFTASTNNQSRTSDSNPNIRILSGRTDWGTTISTEEREARRLRGAAVRARQHNEEGGGFQGLTEEEALAAGEAAMHTGSAAAVSISFQRESEPTKFSDGAYYYENEEVRVARDKGTMCHAAAGIPNRAHSGEEGQGRANRRYPPDGAWYAVPYASMTNPSSKCANRSSMVPPLSSTVLPGCTMVMNMMDPHDEPP